MLSVKCLGFNSRVPKQFLCPFSKKNVGHLKSICVLTKFCL